MPRTTTPISPSPAPGSAEQRSFVYAVALRRDGELPSAHIDVVVDSPDGAIDAAVVDDLAPAFWIIGKKMLETHDLLDRELPPVTITGVRPVPRIADNAKDVGFTVLVTETPGSEHPATMVLDSTTELRDEQSLLLAASALQSATGYLYQSVR